MTLNHPSLFPAKAEDLQAAHEYGYMDVRWRRNSVVEIMRILTSQNANAPTQNELGYPRDAMKIA